MCIGIKSSFTLRDLSSEDKSSWFSVAILLQSERAFKKNTIRKKKSKDQMTGNRKILVLEFSCLGMCESIFIFLSQPVGFEILLFKTNNLSYVVQTLLLIL